MKLKLLIALLFVTGISLAQAPTKDSTIFSAPSTSFTPQFRFKGTSASNQRLQYYNTYLQKWVQIPLAWQWDSYVPAAVSNGFAPKNGSLTTNNRIALWNSNDSLTVLPTSYLNFKPATNDFTSFANWNFYGTTNNIPNLFVSTAPTANGMPLRYEEGLTYTPLTDVTVTATADKIVRRDSDGSLRIGLPQQGAGAFQVPVQNASTGQLQGAFPDSLRSYQSIAIAPFRITAAETYKPGNTGLGHYVLDNITAGVADYTIGVAPEAYTVPDSTQGGENTGVGTDVFRDLLYGSDNTVVGSRSMRGSKRGFYNSILGHNILTDDTLASMNTIAGAFALNNSRLSNSNTVYGFRSFAVADSVNFNDASGVKSFFAMTAGKFNTGHGFGVAQSIRKGEYNTFLGAQTGDGLDSAFNNTILGARVSGLSPNLNNNIIIANGSGSIKAQHDNTNWTFDANQSIFSGGVTIGTTLGVGGVNLTDRTATFTNNSSSYAVTAQQNNSSGLGLQLYSNNAIWGGNIIDAVDNGGLRFRVGSLGNIVSASTIEGTALKLTSTPTTSAGTYKLLTRDATSGDVEVTTALPNGTTATTQSAVDSTDNVATTKFVRQAVSTLTSGTYTPTLTNTTNVSSSTASVCNYFRVGDMVTVTGNFSPTTTTGSIYSEVDISLPIASNLGALTDLSGVGSNSAAGGIFCTNISVDASTGSDKARLSFTAGTAGSGNTIYFTFTYKVI